MKKIIAGTMAAALLMMCTACGELASLTGGATMQQVQGAAPLTQVEITAGLKEALGVGINKGIEYLGKKGYYADMATRIGLPPEAVVITKNIAKIPGGQTLVNNTIKSINAAATDAVKDAAPIFMKAMTEMTITDAAKILSGNRTAATTYFKQKTKGSLKQLFAKRIDNSLQKKLVGDVSAASSWNTLTTEWNDLAGTTVGQVAGFTKVNTDLSDYLTEQAVDILFVKVGEQETEIRTSAAARTTALLKRVFGR